MQSVRYVLVLSLGSLLLKRQCKQLIVCTVTHFKKLQMSGITGDEILLGLLGTKYYSDKLVLFLFNANVSL